MSALSLDVAPLLLSFIEWDIDPIIGSLGPLTFRYYGILFAFGLFWGHWILIKQFERANDNPEAAVTLTYALVGGVVAGSRLGHVFFYNSKYYLANPEEILKFWKGGLASHGAILGLVIVMWVYAIVIRKVPFRVMADRLSVGAIPTLITVRLGNLFNSEVYGRETDLPWGFIFKRIDDVPRHPSQIYEIMTGLLIFGIVAVVMRHYKKKNQERPLGLMSVILFGVYFAMRFLVEFVKAYQADGFKSGADLLTMGQFLSLPFVVFALMGAWAIFFGPWKGQVESDYPGARMPGAPRPIPGTPTLAELAAANKDNENAADSSGSD